jgi:pyridoxal biosynthesis lyase PdxS
MSTFRSWSSAAVAVLALGCGGAPKPEARLASSEGAIRGAQEAGAGNVPEATLHVQLAQEQRQEALTLVKDGDNHRAAMMLARSEADAELAVALTRAANAKAQAARATETVDSLKEKAAQ